MKLKKKILTAILAATLMFSSNILIYAQDNQETSATSEVVNSSIKSRSSQGYSTQPLAGQQMSYSFSVTSDMPYWRVYIDNCSKYDNYKYTITKGSPTGVLVAEGTSNAWTIKNHWATSAYSSGTYYVNFTSGSANMSGSVAARVASTLNEIKP